MAPENLLGIPKELAEEGIGERWLTHVDVTNDWNNFFVSRPNATREEIEGFANLMDEKYGLRTLAYDYFHVQK